MLRGLDGYRYYHKLAHTCVLLSTQLYSVQASNRCRWERIAHEQQWRLHRATKISLFKLKSGL